MFFTPTCCLCPGTTTAAQMLAYGGSKRTLRFSHQEELSLEPFDLIEQLPTNTVASGQLVITPLHHPVGEDIERTPHLLRPSTPSRHCSQKAPPRLSSRSNTSTSSTAIARFPDYSLKGVPVQGEGDGNGRDARVGSITRMDASGGAAGSSSGLQQRRSDVLVPARKRFRLDIDLGSDSDSSCDHVDDRNGDHGGRASTQQERSASGGRLRNDTANPSYGFSNEYRQIAQGDEGSGGTFQSIGLQQRGSARGGVLDRRQSHETPVQNDSGWQSEPASSLEHCGEKELPTSYSSRGKGWRQGEGGGRGGQYLDDHRREIRSQPPFVTPEHAGKDILALHCTEFGTLPVPLVDSDASLRLIFADRSVRIRRFG